MTTLHDRLAALADDVAAGPAEPDLWQRGRQLHRKRRLGTAVIVAGCCLALIALGAIDWQRSRTEFAPANGDNEYGLPDHIHEASKWLPGTSGEPFDPLIAILGTERGGWFGSEYEMVGISAVTGEYRFLDLPDDARDVTLSPDGRRVAYWFTGPAPDYVDHWDDGDPVIGYAVYDVTTAAVERTVIKSNEGVWEGFLGWADNEHLVMSYAFLEWQDEPIGWVGRDRANRLHDIEAGTVRPWPGEWIEHSGSGWTVGWNSPIQTRPIADPDRVVRLRGVSGVPPVPSPSGTSFAGLVAPKTRRGTQATPNPIGIAIPGSKTEARFRQIPTDTPYYRLLGWRDDDTVVAWRWTEDDDRFGDLGDMGMYAVDIDTGQEELLAILDQEVNFAAGLLDAPVVSRPEPPQPLNPWVKVATAALLLTSGGIALLIWRRRVRP